MSSVCIITRKLPEFKPKWTLKKGLEDIYEAYQKYQMNDEKFNGRYYIRLKQIRHLLDSGIVDKDLYWR